MRVSCVAAGQSLVGLGGSGAVGVMGDGFVGGAFTGGWGLRCEWGGLLRFGGTTRAEAGDRVGEGEGADATVQSPHLAAGAWRGGRGGDEGGRKRRVTCRGRGGERGRRLWAGSVGRRKQKHKHEAHPITVSSPVGTLRLLTASHSR